MGKKFFASILAIFGITVGSMANSVSAASVWSDYTAGALVPMPAGDVNVCIYKTGGYTGDTIVAGIAPVRR